MNENIKKENFGIYVHFPFCEKKCRYCDFISFENCDETIKQKYDAGADIIVVGNAFENKELQINQF